LNQLVSPLQIRPFEPADCPAMWGLLEPVFRAGETFPHDPSISEAEARTLWVELSQAVLVALNGNGTVVGSYYLRPNSHCLGAHVANAGYVVAEHCRRQGIGIRCWQRNGFQIVGTLPGAFRHNLLGYVDALVMVQQLVEGPNP